MTAPRAFQLFDSHQWKHSDFSGDLPNIVLQPGSMSRWGRAQAYLAESLGSKTLQALAPSPNSSTLWLVFPSSLQSLAKSGAQENREVLGVELPALIATP